MSTHERERLSAYLDDELPPAERAAVEAHLAACAACRGRLAELAAVDEAAAGLPADAPDGYFDGFALRVRERLEARPVVGTRSGRRLPPWAWAVAAALVLAVVTPLTWRERSALAPKTALQAAPEAPLETGETRRAPAAAAPDQPRPRARSDAPRPQAGVTASAPAPAAPPPAAPGPAPQRVAAPMQGGARPSGAALPGEVSPPSLEEKAEAANAAAAPEASGAMAAVQRREAGSGAAADAVAGGREAVALGHAKAAAPASVATEVTPSVEFRRLASESAVRVEEWRALRERWRLFAAEHPEDARVDEARVRVIACGLEAVRAGGGEADRATLARDADAYLARADARQRARVRSLLEAAASR